MEMNQEKIPPHIDDERPWAQGFNDWMAFGDDANAFSAKMIGFEEYLLGKSDAKSWFYGTNMKSKV